MMDIFGKKRIAKLEESNALMAREIERLNSMLTPEMRDSMELSRRNDEARGRLDQAIRELGDLTKKNSELDQLLLKKRATLLEIDDEILAEEFGLYKAAFKFATSTKYKEAIDKLRKEEREEIKRINEVAKTTSWTVNNSASQGRKMVGDITRLLIRAFNNECDDLIGKVKSTNIDKTIERIQKSANDISKRGSVIHVTIPQSYVTKKIQEARLAYEFALVKEREKEELREAKAREREELKVKKEIEAKRKELKKEQAKYKKALEDAQRKLLEAGDESKTALEKKIKELKGNLDEVDKGIQDVDYREANKRAGFVYIISNLGSFGSDVFKIGMTRRLEPMERIMELSDASVPFNFDVHALIFTDDAPALEAALHHEFEDRKLNLVNQRREFFKCSLDEIKQAVVKNYDKTVEFKDFADAEQFRVSEKMREAKNNKGQTARVLG